MGLISPGSGVRAPPGASPRSYSVMVITKDSDSFNPGSSPGRTFLFVIFAKQKKIEKSKMNLQIAVFRALSSAVERRIADPEVTGSIPVVPLFCFLFFWIQNSDGLGVRRERVASTGHWSSGMILL